MIADGYRETYNLKIGGEVVVTLEEYLNEAGFIWKIYP